MTTIHDFSKELQSTGVSFSGSKESVAAALRKLAAEIEAGEFTVQGIDIHDKLKTDEFVMRTIEIEGFEKRPKGNVSRPIEPI